MMKSILSVFLAGVILFCPFLNRQTGCIASDLPDSKMQLAMALFKDVPYVPTPDAVVSQMLKMGEVRSGDVVYDLGCGDGRMVIAAAKLGAHGVGIDIDYPFIVESRHNAEKAGVLDKVKFISKDIFESDIHDATVILIYLLPEINLKLRPKFLKELKPGTKVVSHNYSMKEWRPDEVAKVDRHTVYKWIVPGNVSGTWKWSTPGGRAANCVLNVNQKFQILQADLMVGTAKAQAVNATIYGNIIRIAAAYTAQGKKVTAYFEGRVKADKIEGFAKSAVNGSWSKSTLWKPKRDPKTAKPLWDREANS